MKPEHETRDADVASLFLIVVMLFVAGALILSGVWTLIHYLRVKQASADARTPPFRVASGAFPEPRLETRPSITLEAVRAYENKTLNSYGWIDRDHGVTRIPIDQAMQLLLKRGLPDVGAGQTPLQLMQGPPQQFAP